jgi:hypothetical protein
MIVESPATEKLTEFAQLQDGRRLAPDSAILAARRLKMKIFSLLLLFLVTTAAAAPQTRTTWDGFITDTHCGTHCQRTSHMTPDPACVRLCVRRGSKYGLWYKDRVYVLEPQAKAAKFAAESVRVTGSLSGDTIHIRSISPTPVDAVGFSN